MPGLDHFKPLTPDQIKKKQEELAAMQEHYKKVSRLAQECLSDPKFKKYRTEYEALQEELLTFMYDYPANPDPMQDAFFLRASINKLGVLREILTMISKDVKKGKKKGGQDA